MVDKKEMLYELRSGSITSFELFLPKDSQIQNVKFKLAVIKDSIPGLNEMNYWFVDETKTYFIHTSDVHDSANVPGVSIHHIKIFAENPDFKFKRFYTN